MNSGKKILKEQGLNNSKKKKKRGIVNQNALRLIVSIVAALVMIIVAVVGYEQLHPRLIVTVNGEKIYLKELMYDIYSSEAYNNSMDQFYMAYNGVSYWNSEVEGGMTGSEFAQEQVLNSVIEREILYRRAVDAEYNITDEDRTKAVETANSTRKEMSFIQKTLSGMSAKALVSVLEKDNMAQRYKQDLINSFDIDDEAIRAGVVAADFRQYDIQYYYGNYQTTDENGETISISDEEKATRKEKIDAIYEKAQTAEDFTTLISEEEKEGSVIQFVEKGLIETDTTLFGEDLRKQVKAMENGTMTQVVEDETGCYIIKMIENNSTESYEAEVKKKITEQEDAKYKEEYEKLLSETSVEVNYDEWDKIVLGKVTL